MGLDNRKSKTTAILIGVGIFLIVIIFTIWLWGTQGIMKVVMVILEISLGLAGIFGIMYLFWFIFIKKNKVDVNYINKQKLLEACHRIKYPLMKELYVSGDKGHSRGKVGKITGWCRIQIAWKNFLYKETTDPETGAVTKKPLLKTSDNGVEEHLYEVDKMEQDVFSIKEPGLIGIFKEDMVIRCDPQDHNELVGDIDLFGFSLIPKSEYWFLNGDLLDLRKIEYSLLREAEQTTLFMVLSDMAEVTNRATGVDSAHKKFLEKKSLVELPETQNVGNQQSPYQ
jgi:hypothetical protein